MYMKKGQVNEKINVTVQWNKFCAVALVMIAITSCWYWPVWEAVFLIHMETFQRQCKSTTFNLQLCGVKISRIVGRAHSFGELLFNGLLLTTGNQQFTRA